MRATCEYYRNVWTTAEQVKAASAEPLELPTLVLSGEKSLGQSMVDAVHRLARDAQSSILPGCGHLIAEEYPDELLGHLRSFLDPSGG